MSSLSSGFRSDMLFACKFKSDMLPSKPLKQDKSLIEAPTIATFCN